MRDDELPSAVLRSKSRGETCGTNTESVFAALDWEDALIAISKLPVAERKQALHAWRDARRKGGVR